jgi:hypothetical protein
VHFSPSTLPGHPIIRILPHNPIVHVLLLINLGTSTPALPRVTQLFTYSQHQYQQQEKDPVAIFDGIPRRV